MSLGNQPEVAPVHDLQRMLQTVLKDSVLLRDGIFGKETAEAVRSYQRQQQLPVTGTVDEDTWNALRDDYRVEIVLQGPAQPLEIILQPYQVLTRGTDNLHMYLVQAMLYTLSLYFLNLPQLKITGILDAETEAAIRELQCAAGLPISGEVDKHTWRHLAKQYRSTVGDGTGQFPVRSRNNA